MEAYLQLMKHVLENGKDRGDRTGTGTRSVFGYQMRFDLQEGFPMTTTKKIPFRLVVEELLWFLRGDTNIKYLVDRDVHIWDDWPFARWFESSSYDGTAYVPNWKEKRLKDEEYKQLVKSEMKRFAACIKEDEVFAKEWGELGNVYGKQWRSWEGADGATIDQIANVVRNIKENPDSRRLIVSAWNVADVEAEYTKDEEGRTTGMALPPCHAFFQFYVAEGKLSCQLFQRSVDLFLGANFNFASYALLTHMIAQQCDLEVGELIWTGGDVHIYHNHFEQARIQLEREPKPLPSLEIRRKPNSIFDYTWEDFELIGYDAHPHIPADVAI